MTAPMTERPYFPFYSDTPADHTLATWIVSERRTPDNPEFTGTEADALKVTKAMNAAAGRRYREEMEAALLARIREQGRVSILKDPAFRASLALFGPE